MYLGQTYLAGSMDMCQAPASQLYLMEPQLLFTGGVSDHIDGGQREEVQEKWMDGRTKKMDESTGRCFPEGSEAVGSSPGSWGLKR